jgi:50S ribosomal protein L16 3-hydroxylase
MVSMELRWGNSSVVHFLTHHWQRQPLLLRGFVEPAAVNAELDHLLHHARSEAVPSRLIRHRNAAWLLTHGPFHRLPSLRTPNWTILLQGMDCVHPQAHALRCAFSFLPQARIDDVMISVAGRGGGVGAHADAYDVFLVQGRGRRRWRWGWQSDHSLQCNAPLKLLLRFDPQQEAVLGPGDALYLPPSWCHEGEALEPCSTWSVGFRAPSRKEFLTHFLCEAADPVCGANPRYADPYPHSPYEARLPKAHPPSEPRDWHRLGRPAQTGTPVSPLLALVPTAPGESARIPQRLQDQLERWALSYRPTRKTLRRALGRFLTEPLPHVGFELPAEGLALADFAMQACEQGVHLAPGTRMLYNASQVWINGESAGSPGRWIRRLADQRELAAHELRREGSRRAPKALNPESVEIKCKQSVDFPPLFHRLHCWYSWGWIQCGPLPFRSNL